MAFKFLRAAWWTLKSWRRAHGRKPLERPGSDEQWTVWPAVRPGWVNHQRAEDEDEARGGRP